MKRSVSDTLRRLERERKEAEEKLEAQAKQRLLVRKFQSSSPLDTAFRRETVKYPSKISIDLATPRARVILSPEMQERERKAQEEIERKKKCIAPHYSKGPYQYVTEGIDLSTLGKKV